MIGVCLFYVLASPFVVFVFHLFTVENTELVDGVGAGFRVRSVRAAAVVFSQGMPTNGLAWLTRQQAL